MITREFVEPGRCIRTEEDLQAFVHGRTVKQLASFISQLCESVVGKPIRGRALIEGPEISNPPSARATAVLGLLRSLSTWIDEIAPVQHPSRFGNKAYRIWHARLEKEAEDLLKSMFAECPEFLPAVIELKPYLCDSFGNASRIDYGTGHETAFLAFLYILNDIGFFTERHEIVTVVFACYIEVMRRLQDVYMLEPAGSHGVWGLDDFHHLPFIFGAAQLRDQDYLPADAPFRIRPSQVLDPAVLERAPENLYIDAIRVILNVKKGAPFAETSPVLDSVRQVEKWEKVSQGMLKMYQGEVLVKRPVIQHFLFGSVLQFP